MLNFLKQLFLILCVVLQTATISAYENDKESDFFNYHFAIVRDLPITFLHSLKQHEPEIPIDYDLAKQQHEKYIEVLQGLVPKLIRLKADSYFPDCNFVEDTGLIIGDIAVLSRLGAPERQGEEAAVYEALNPICDL